MSEDNGLHLDMLINKKRGGGGGTSRLECHTLKRDLSIFYEHAMKSTIITSDLQNFCKYASIKLDKIITNYEKIKINKLD
jgi:hypothetical protein